MDKKTQELAEEIDKILFGDDERAMTPAEQLLLCELLDRFKDDAIKSNNGIVLSESFFEAMEG